MPPVFPGFAPIFAKLATILAEFAYSHFDFLPRQRQVRVEQLALLRAQRFGLALFIHLTLQVPQLRGYGALLLQDLLSPGGIDPIVPQVAAVVPQVAAIVAQFPPFAPCIPGIPLALRIA